MEEALEVCLEWNGIGEMSVIKGVKEVHQVDSSGRLGDLPIFLPAASNTGPGDVVVFKRNLCGPLECIHCSTLPPFL